MVPEMEWALEQHRPLGETPPQKLLAVLSMRDLLTNFLPTGGTYECSAPDNSAADVTVTDNCDGAPTVVYTVDTTPGSCAYDFVELRKLVGIKCPKYINRCFESPVARRL